MCFTNINTIITLVVAGYRNYMILNVDKNSEYEGDFVLVNGIKSFDLS